MYIQITYMHIYVIITGLCFLSHPLVANLIAKELFQLLNNGVFGCHRACLSYMSILVVLSIGNKKRSYE